MITLSSFLPVFYFRILCTAEGQVNIGLQASKQMLLAKTTIAFLNLQSLKILCFPVVLEVKEKSCPREKWKKKKGKKEGRRRVKKGINVSRS